MGILKNKVELSQEEIEKKNKKLARRREMETFLMLLLIVLFGFAYYMYNIKPINYIEKNAKNIAEDVLYEMAEESICPPIIKAFINNSDVTDVFYDKSSAQLTVRFDGPDLDDFHAALLDNANSLGYLDVFEYLTGLKNIDSDVIDCCSIRKYKVIVKLDSDSISNSSLDGDAVIKKYLEAKMDKQFREYIVEQFEDAGLA